MAKDPGNFRPMLAPHENPLKYPNYFRDLQKRYPLVVSPKYDGIRGLIKCGVVMSRKFIALPSYQVQQEFSKYEDMDGEFIAGCPTDFGVYNRSQSHVMSEDKPGDITYNVFDFTPKRLLERPFIERLEALKVAVNHYDDSNLIMIDHDIVDNEDELLAYEDKVLEEGFEGVIWRDPYGFYKQGRGTWREGLIGKLKREQDDEGVIVGFVEANNNTNVSLLDGLGYAKRSQKKEGLVPNGMLGKFVVDFQGMIINVAPGVYTHAERIYIWEHQDEYLGKILKFRHFPHGKKDAPRQARALGLRSPIDI